MAAGPTRRDVISGGATALGLFCIGGRPVCATSRSLGRRSPIYYVSSTLRLPK